MSESEFNEEALKAELSAREWAGFESLRHLLASYDTIMLIPLDSVPTSQLTAIRRQLKGRVHLQVCRNFVIRCALHSQSKDKPELLKLVPHIRGQVTLAFLSATESVAEIQLLLSKMIESKSPKYNGKATVDFMLPKGYIIDTRHKTLRTSDITVPFNRQGRGGNDIVLQEDAHLLKKGHPITFQAARMLEALWIKIQSPPPTATMVYQAGFIFDSQVLLIEDDDIVRKLQAGLTNLAVVWEESKLAGPTDTRPTPLDVLTRKWLEILKTRGTTRPAPSLFDDEPDSTSSDEECKAMFLFE